MKKIISIFLFFILLFGIGGIMPNISNAIVINVAGQQIDIPAKYKTWWVEKNASRCVGKLLPLAQTEFAAKQIPITCVNMILNKDFSWDK